MVLKLAGQAARKIKGAFKLAKDLQPGIRKASDMARAGYREAKSSGLLEQVAGSERAKQIDQVASKASNAYDRLSEMAEKSDKVVGAMSRA